jgi:hypothetical protein
MRRFIVPPSEGSIEPGPVPTFSVVIPAYQSAGFITEAVESALGQTLAPHEVVVIDDGSTDDVESALASYRSRITFIRKPHRGAGAARNEALLVASGDFVAMLDADDRFEGDRLLALGELAAARPDLDILGTDALFEFRDGVGGCFYDSTAFAPSDQRLAILDRCFVAWPAIRRTRVIEVGGFDESPAIAPAEDWDLFLRLIFGGSKAGIVDEPLLRYRRHPASMTANRVRTLQSRVALLEKARSQVLLSSAERRYLEFCLTRAQTRASLVEARQVVGARPTAFRRSLLRLASTPDIRQNARLAITAAALAPRAGARLLTWSERHAAKSRPRTWTPRSTTRPPAPVDHVASARRSA